MLQAMGWINFVGLGLLIVFGVLGAVRGALAGALRIGSLLAAYASAFLAASALASAVASMTGLNPFLGGVVAGTVSFVGVYTIASVSASILLRRARKRRGDDPRSPLDRAGGALIGLAQGGVVLILLGWVVACIHGIRLGQDPEAEVTEKPLVSRLSQHVVESSARAVLGDDPGAALAVQLIADPAGTANDMQSMLDHPRFADLQEDGMFWQYLSTGAIDSALNRSSFLRVAHDDALRARAVDLGLVPEAARDNPSEFRSSARVAFEQVAPRLSGLRDDPAIQRLAEDPEVQQALADGNAVAMLAHPEFRALLERVMARESDER